MEFKNLSTYWLDKETFCFAFDGGIDDEGDAYSILCEYHSDEDKFIFARWYEYDTTETDFTEEQKEYIKTQMRQYMNNGYHGSLYCAKRIDNGKWVKGYYMPRPNLPMGEVHYIVNVCGTKWFEVDPSTIHQCTDVDDNLEE